MNAPRRKELETAQEKLTEIKEMISDILADEQDYSEYLSILECVLFPF
jgi:hypothetical protein